MRFEAKLELSRVHPIRYERENLQLMIRTGMKYEMTGMQVPSVYMQKKYIKQFFGDIHSCKDMYPVNGAPKKYCTNVIVTVTQTMTAKQRRRQQRGNDNVRIENERFYKWMHQFDSKEI